MGDGEVGGYDGERDGGVTVGVWGAGDGEECGGAVTSRENVSPCCWRELVCDSLGTRKDIISFKPPGPTRKRRGGPTSNTGGSPPRYSICGDVLAQIQRLYASESPSSGSVSGFPSPSDHPWSFTPRTIAEAIQGSSQGTPTTSHDRNAVGTETVLEEIGRCPPSRSAKTLAGGTKRLQDRKACASQEGRGKGVR